MMIATSFSRFDATGYLADLGAAAAYFEATMEDDGDDPPALVLPRHSGDRLPGCLRAVRERGLIGGSGPNAAICRPTLAGLDFLGETADVVKEAIVALTFAVSCDRDAMGASVRASSLP